MAQFLLSGQLMVTLGHLQPPQMTIQLLLTWQSLVEDLPVFVDVLLDVAVPFIT